MNEQTKQSFLNIIDLALRQGGINALTHANACISHLNSVEQADKVEEGKLQQA